MPGQDPTGTDNVKSAGASSAEYLLTVSAVKKAISSFPHAQHDIADTLTSISAPASLLTWLQHQPSDVVTKGCRAAACKGSLALTMHLLDRLACCMNQRSELFNVFACFCALSYSEKVAMAMVLCSCSVDMDALTALRQSFAASTEASQEGEGVQAADEMLFYVDEAGESAFGK